MGSERGFTYRLVLTPSADGPAQLLIRNAAVAGEFDSGALNGSGHRIAALAELVRAAAAGSPPAGYSVEAVADSPNRPNLTVAEIWRGAHYEVLVLHVAADAAGDAEALAKRFGPRAAAAWIAEPRPAGHNRRAVVVREGVVQ